MHNSASNGSYSNILYFILWVPPILIRPQRFESETYLNKPYNTLLYVVFVGNCESSSAIAALVFTESALLHCIVQSPESVDPAGASLIRPNPSQ